MSCLQAIEGEDTEKLLIDNIMNLLWALSDKGTRVRFCWVPSHCGIEGNEIVDQLAEDTLGHDLDPLTTDHHAYLKPLVNSYIHGSRSNQVGCIYRWYRSISLETKTRTINEIPVPDTSWVGCNNPSSNWPYQGHKVPYLVTRAAEYLLALWPDSDHRTHAPGVYSAARKSWWILHSCLIGDLLWDDSRGLHSRVSASSWILLSDMNWHISSTISYLG